MPDPPCPYCGSKDVDWSRKDQKYGCYRCGKMFDGKPPKTITEEIAHTRARKLKKLLMEEETK